MQTASIVDYFYPVTDADQIASAETMLAQSASSGRSHSLAHIKSESDLEADLEAKTNSALKALADLESDIELDTSSVSQSKN